MIDQIKLIIQIPCHNEEESLPATLESLPRRIAGVDIVEWLIIDDGSTDNTLEIAKAFKVDHIVSFIGNQGLAKAFVGGIEACLHLGADVIVNTDADNQYFSGDIPALVTPILNGEADIVVGVRPIHEIKHFSLTKKILQVVGSYVVRKVSNTTVSDTTSGFRAYSRNAAMQMNVFDNFTYTLETTIQAGQKNLPILCIPVRVNGETRPSRLAKGTFSYVKRSMKTIIRVFVVYRPFIFFSSIGISLCASGFVICVRFLYYFYGGRGSGHIQSLVLASILIGIGVQTLLIAFVADLISVNRRLIEDLQYRLRKTEHDGKKR
jgi:glycosyltransferase involved in cell wall biosynthesis